VLAPGTTLGPYTIGDLLGVGGMGEVYRAHDTRLNRELGRPWNEFLRSHVHRNASWPHHRLFTPRPNLGVTPLSECST
jgi:hypothetical protein